MREGKPELEKFRDRYLSYTSRFSFDYIWGFLTQAQRRLGEYAEATESIRRWATALEMNSWPWPKDKEDCLAEAQRLAQDQGISGIEAEVRKILGDAEPRNMGLGHAQSLPGSIAQSAESASTLTSPVIADARSDRAGQKDFANVGSDYRAATFQGVAGLRQFVQDYQSLAEQSRNNPPANFLWRCLGLALWEIGDQDHGLSALEHWALLLGRSAIATPLMKRKCLVTIQGLVSTLNRPDVISHVASSLALDVPRVNVPQVQESLPAFANGN